MISDTKGDSANHQTPQPERNLLTKHSFICPILKFNILILYIFVFKLMSTDQLKSPKTIMRTLGSSHFSTSFTPFARVF